MKVQRYLLNSLIANWIIVSFTFLPLLYLSDFLFHDKFDSVKALAKIPMRYGQSFGILVLWSAWLSIRSMRKKYSDMAFISIGFRPKDSLKFICIFAIFCATLEWGVIIPINDYLFPSKIKITDWIVKDSGEKILFINKLNEKDMDIWIYDKHDNLKYSSAKFDNKEIEADTCTFVKDPTIGWQTAPWKYRQKIEEKDFYIIWRESRKLSWKGLKEMEEYWKYHELKMEDSKNQWHVFVSRVFLLFGLLICGTAWGWQNNMKEILICSIVSSWFYQVSMFLPLPFSVIVVWINAIAWIVVGLCYLL